MSDHFDSNNRKKSENQVVDLSNYRAERMVRKELAGDRKPLYVSYLEGKVKGSPHLNSPTAQDFGDRIQRVRMTLDKVNQLLSDLKKIAKVEAERS